MPSIINALTASGGGVAITGDATGNLALQTAGNTAVTVNTSKGVQFDNCIGVGNATPSTSGAGITFPATQSASSNANTLDDYEEGTWTPVVTFSGNSVGQSYASQSGKYTKIGNQVFLSCIITMTNKGSSTGAAWVTGVPFTENGDYGIGWTALDGGFANIPSNGFGTYGIIAGSAIYLRYTTSAGGFTNLDNTNFTNSSQLYINLFYKTT